MGRHLSSLKERLEFAEAEEIAERAKKTHISAGSKAPLYKFLGTFLS